MAYSDLSQDANGWTVFTSSSGARIFYISESGSASPTKTYYSPAEVGGNVFEPDSAMDDPWDTYAHVIASGLVRDGYGDYILFKRGETFSAAIGDRSGASDTDLAVTGAYGSSGIMPVIHPTSAGTISLQLYNTFQRLAIFGLDFYHSTRDPDSGDYVSQDGAYGVRLIAGSGETIRQVVIEGCKFRFHTGNLLQNNGGTVEDIVFRRNIVLNQYSSGDQVHGVFASFLDDFLFEENILDHNGWYEDGGPIGDPNQFSHGAYFSTMDDLVFRKNIVMRSSSCNTKMEVNATQQTNLEFDDNLWIDGDSALLVGVNEEAAGYLTNNLIVTDNIATNLDRSNLIGVNLGWGMIFSQVNGGEMSGNILMNWENPAGTNTFGLRLQTRLKDFDITNNVIYNMNPHGNSDSNPAVRLHNAFSDCSNNTISGNYFQEPTDDFVMVLVAEEDDLSAFTFSGNEYYAASQVFTIEGTPHTFAQWVADTGDTSSFAAHSFPAATRDIETYMQSLGETATIDAFVAKCRAQDRFSWDTDYTAEVVNAWIRAGFFGAAPSPAASRLIMVLR